MSQTALAEMRALLSELRYAGAPAENAAAPVARAADALTRHGLVGALRRHVRDLAADGLSVTLHSRGYVPLPVEQEFELFRIAQEALHNVSKHAGARSVDVRVTSTADGTLLRVHDDGSGFDQQPAAVARRSEGHGLRTMRERAESLGGRFAVVSVPGAGTTVEIAIPAGYATGRAVSSDARSDL